MEDLEQARHDFAEAELQLRSAQTTQLEAQFAVQTARREVQEKRVALRRAEHEHERKLRANEKKRIAEAALELSDLAREDVATLKHLLESGTIKHDENRRWAKEKIGE